MDYNIFPRETDVMPIQAPERHFQAYSSSGMHYDYDNQDSEDRIGTSSVVVGIAVVPHAKSYPSIVSPIAPGAQFRHDPPISYQQSLATSDNDPYVDSTQGPSTPPNNVILSPHIAPQDSHSPRLVLAGLADPGAGSGGFTSTPFHDNNSNPFASLNTPTFGANTKIQTFTAYPELQDADAEDAQTDDGSIDLPSRANRDDDEYKPTRRTKSSRAPKATPRRGRPRRSSS
ncbi:hypothetical protein CDV36_016414, partial [Fusarium kuroshium]